MKLKELQEKLAKLGLGMVWDIDKKNVSVGNPAFANPLLWVNAYDEYDGSVRVKSINIPLYTESQVRGALLLVDEFMSTLPKDRGLGSNVKVS